MITQDYADQQIDRDAEYQSAYRQWVQSLPDHERRSLRSVGLEKPVSGYHGNGAPAGDATDSPAMSCGQDPALEPETAEPVPRQSCDHETIWDVMRRLVGEVLYHDNARLTVECLALVSGLAYSGASMTEIARRHGITRAAVSKRCVELTELLDLRPSRAMRSLTAREQYRSARIRSTRSHD